MLKGKLLTKALKLAAVSTLCISLIIPGTVNAAHDVYKPENEIVLNDFDGATENNLNNYAELWYSENSKAELQLVTDNENNKIKINFPGGVDKSATTLDVKINRNLVNDDFPYLVFNMKTDIGWGGFNLYANCEGADESNKSVLGGAEVERSEDFADLNKEIRKQAFTNDLVPALTGGANWSYFFGDGKEYEYRINLKEAFKEYNIFSNCWSLQFVLWRNNQETDCSFTFDNFRLESGKGIVAYETYDEAGIDISKVFNKAEDSNWTGEIANKGIFGSPALVLKASGKDNDFANIALARGKNVDLFSNGKCLYWHMNVDAGTEINNLNMALFLQSNGERFEFSSQSFRLLYSETLSGLMNGNTSSVDVIWGGWSVSIPTGSHWFCLNLEEAFPNIDDNIKRKLQNVDAIDFVFNQTNNQNTMNATFIIDSISSSVKEIIDGDANCDGTVDILDLVRVEKYAAGIQTEICAAADLDGNSEINDADSILLRKKLLEK